MNIVALFLLFLIPIGAPRDPARGPFRRDSQLQNLECERLTVEAARRDDPGLVRSAMPRGDFAERSVLRCEERLRDAESASARDAAILLDLQERAQGLVSATDALATELAGRIWLVEVNDPNPQLASKLSFATKLALADRGLAVSDRVPLWGPDDVDVLRRMEPEAALPLACGRAHDTGALGPSDVLLVVSALDVRETTVHGGLCVDGSWRWLR